MFECDVIAIVGFITGILVAVTVAGTIFVSDVRFMGIMGPIVALVVFYISRRREWLKKEENYIKIQEKIDSIIKEHEGIEDTLTKQE